MRPKPASALSFSEGYTTWGGSANNGSENTIYAFNNDLTWIKGKHTFKAGAMYQRNHYNGFGRQCIAGCATFTSKTTGFPGDPNFTTGGGNPFASFLLGWVDNGSVDTIRFIGQQWPYFAGYFQDDWKVSQQADIESRHSDGRRRFPLSSKRTAGWTFLRHVRIRLLTTSWARLIFAGTGEGREGTRTLADSWYGGWGPHIGLAYSLTPNTVIRSSYSRSFAVVTTVTGSTHNQGFSTNPGFSTQDNGVTPAFLLSGSFPAFPQPPFINPSGSNGLSIPWFQNEEAARMPEYNSWNFSIQRQLTGSMVLDLSYNGQAGSHLQSALLNINQVDPRYLQTLGPAVLNSNINSRCGVGCRDSEALPDVQRLGRPGAASISAVFGNRHLVGRRRPQRPLDLSRRYRRRWKSGTAPASRSRRRTCSRSYSRIPTPIGSPTIRAPRTSTTGSLEKSIGFYDITHNFKLGLVYDLPFGKGREHLTSGFMSVLLGELAC